MRFCEMGYPHLHYGLAVSCEEDATHLINTDRQVRLMRKGKGMRSRRCPWDRY